MFHIIFGMLCDKILKSNVKESHATTCLYESREGNDLAVTTHNVNNAPLRATPCHPLPFKAARQPSNCRNNNEYYE